MDKALQEELGYLLDRLEHTYSTVAVDQANRATAQQLREIMEPYLVVGA